MRKERSEAFDDDDDEGGGGVFEGVVKVEMALREEEAMESGRCFFLCFSVL